MFFRSPKVLGLAATGAAGLYVAYTTVKNFRIDPTLGGETIPNSMPLKNPNCRIAMFSVYPSVTCIDPQGNSVSFTESDDGFFRLRSS